MKHIKHLQHMELGLGNKFSGTTRCRENAIFHRDLPIFMALVPKIFLWSHFGDSGG